MDADSDSRLQVTGPGSELIHQIVNGEDESGAEEAEVYGQGEYEPAYEIQTSPSKTSSRGVAQRRLYGEGSSKSSQSSARSHR